VAEFLVVSRQRGLKAAETMVAASDGRLWWALLPAISPGRTALLLSPSFMPSEPARQHAQALTAATCGMLAGRGVRLTQLLLDPAEKALAGMYESCGFSTLAELIYLHRAVRRGEQSDVPADVQLLHYQPDLHADFREALEGSYQGSLDCPALTGRRDLDDVLIGHRGGGEFDPTWWTLVRKAGRPAGLLLINAPRGGVSAELVYLGLAPWARGCGLGDLLMRRAIDTAARAQLAELMLAVDTRNAPALALYYRFGMRRMTSRLALMRDLTPGAPPFPAPPLGPS
jgi:ribosomal protein S18 acetylase RimI-like enzyme